MNALIKVGAGWLLMGSAVALASSGPLSIVRGAGKIAPLSHQKLLYLKDDLAVVRSPAASEEDFRDLYVVNMHNFFAMPEHFREFGEVLQFAEGSFAVMRVAPDKVEELSGQLHAAGLACGVLERLTGAPMELETGGTPAPVLPVNARDARVVSATEKVQSANIRTVIEELANMHTRYHSSPTGHGVADVLAEKYESLRMGRSDVTISTYDHGSATSQRSLVVRIEGQTRPSEVIILGSHIDSVNWRDGSSSRSPGVDDNASGTATNLEVFRILMEEGIRLERTLEIHGYAAEEIGLVGSQDMATDYKNAGVNVVAMVQHDMTLWKAQGTEDKIWFVTNNTDAGFNDQLAQLTDLYTGLAWGKAALSGGSSDHASWRRAGFATAFPFENPQGYNRNIHTAHDDLTNANALEQAAGFAKLGLSYIMHFGGLN